MSRSTLVLLAALGLVALLARSFFTASGAKPPAASMAAREPERVVATASAAPAARANAAPIGAPSPAAELAREETVVTPAQAEKMRATAAALRQQARFPPTSRRIENGIDPIVETRAVKERMSSPGQGRSPTLVVFSSSLS